MRTLVRRRTTLNERAKIIDKIHQDTLKIHLFAGQRPKFAKTRHKILTAPWVKPPSKIAREIIAPANSTQRQDNRPIRSEKRAKLVQAIAQRRSWLSDFVEGNVSSVEDIASREHCSARQVNRAMTLALLPPRLVEAAVAGKLPRGIGVASIHQLPAEWSKQYRLLGLKP